MISSIISMTKLFVSEIAKHYPVVWFFKKKFYSKKHAKQMTKRKTRRRKKRKVNEISKTFMVRLKNFVNFV